MPRSVYCHTLYSHRLLCYLLFSYSTFIIYFNLCPELWFRHEHERVLNTHDLMFSIFWSSATPLWGECQALIHTCHPVLMSRQTHLLHTIQGHPSVRGLGIYLGIYLLLCRAAVNWLPQAGCQGQGVLLWRRAPWSPVIPPRHLCRSCTASLWHGLHPAASKQHCSLQKYRICHLCLNPQWWIMFVSVRWRAQEGKETERKECFETGCSYMHRAAGLLSIPPLCFMSTQSGSKGFCRSGLSTLVRIYP